MGNVEQFFNAIQHAGYVTLATSENDEVTMRIISPALYEKHILFFTHSDSIKYRQLQANPRCCISTRYFVAYGEAQFRGATMARENILLRDEYCEKFRRAFDSNSSFNGCDAEFILIKINKIKGWSYENEQDAGITIPTVPFEITLNSK